MRVIPVTGPSYATISASFEEAKAAIGGYVEPLALPGGGYLLVDEDGRSKELPPNLEASRLAGVSIVGPAVLVAPSEVGAVLG